MCVRITKNYAINCALRMNRLIKTLKRMAKGKADNFNLNKMDNSLKFFPCLAMI